MIAPRLHLPHVRVAAVATLLSLLGVVALIEAPARMRPWMPRFRDAAIRCEGRHCDVDRVRVRTLLETPAALASSARLVPSGSCGGLYGFKVYAVRPGSLLARLGLRNGDKILRINGEPLASPDSAMRLYHTIRSARLVMVELQRGRELVTLSYTIH